MKDSKDVAAGDWIEWILPNDVGIGLRLGAKGRIVLVQRVGAIDCLIRVAFIPGSVDPHADHENISWNYPLNGFRIIPDPTSTAITPAAGLKRPYTGLFNLQGNTVQDYIAQMEAEDSTRSA